MAPTVFIERERTGEGRTSKWLVISLAIAGGLMGFVIGLLFPLRLLDPRLSDDAIRIDVSSPELHVKTRP